MAREYRYELREAPVSTNDGTTGVGHHIAAVWREDGTDDPWQEVPEHHIVGMQIAGNDLVTALSSGTISQKVKKYKDLIRAALDASGFIESYDKGWEEEKLDGFMINNDTSLAASILADEFIHIVKPAGYPVHFELGG